MDILLRTLRRSDLVITTRRKNDFPHVYRVIGVCTCVRDIRV